MFLRIFFNRLVPTEFKFILVPMTSKLFRDFHSRQNAAKPIFPTKYIYDILSSDRAVLVKQIAVQLPCFPVIRPYALLIPELSSVFLSTEGKTGYLDHN